VQERGAGGAGDEAAGGAGDKAAAGAVEGDGELGDLGPIDAFDDEEWDLYA
jgi:hypothetical protein